MDIRGAEHSRFPGVLDQAYMGLGLAALLLGDYFRELNPSTAQTTLVRRSIRVIISQPTFNPWPKASRKLRTRDVRSISLLRAVYGLSHIKNGP